MKTRVIAAGALVASLCAATLTGAVPAAADESPLHAGPAPRPGPDASKASSPGSAAPAAGPALLYAAQAEAPKLLNAPGSVWQAPPILVSGASAYRRGEFLYQDFLYDDAGATSDRQTQAVPANAQRAYSGKYTYPSDARYGGNAADLVELWLRPLPDATAFRVTLNTMLEPSLAAVTIALGGTAGTLRDFPHGASVRAPADLFVTAHAAGGQPVADLVDAASGARRDGHGATATVDQPRGQIEIRVPHADWDPASGRVRLAMGVGLWDAAADRYMIPQATRDQTRPGGAGSLASPPAFFNVGPRYSEPYNRAPVAAADTADTVNAWREGQQAQVLATGDISAFSAQVDFAKLASAVDDDLPGQVGGVPQTGYLNRILASHFGLPAGRGPSGSASLQPGSCATPCVPGYAGQLQPYELYVPPSPPPSGRWALTLDLHPAGGSHNEQLGSRRQRQLGGRAGGSLVLTPNARGPEHWYYGQALADVFEAWADVARNYPVDADRVAITGISMGGYGAYKIAALYPDLFTSVAPVVGCTTAGVSIGFAASTTAASSVVPLVAGYRNVPMMSWAAPVDEFCPYQNATAVRDALDALGYRWSLWTLTGEHLSLSVVDDFQAIADWMGGARVDRNPAHITYVLNTQMDEERFGLGTDHVYWLSGLEVRDPASNGGRGTIDVVSHGFGVGDAPALPAQPGGGVLLGGVFPAAYVSQTRTWGVTPSTAASNALTVTATNVGLAVIHVDRARVGCDADVTVASDGPMTVRLAGCDRTITVGS